MIRKNTSVLSQLYTANRIIRCERPVDCSCTQCDLFREGGLLEISLPSYRCCHDAAGGCIMCNFGIGSERRPESNCVLSQMCSVLDNLHGSIHTILLSTNGSVLDRNNVGEDLLFSILRYVELSSIESIIIETHIDTVTEAQMLMLRKYLPTKNIILEVGLESSNCFIQKYCYLKEIPMNNLFRLMRIADKYCISFQFNVILGAPFLTRKEQIDDTYNTICWVLDKGAMVTLFPMNVKPYTLLEYALNCGIYEPISHWCVPLLLSKFGCEDLEKIDLAWYGNRQITYNDSHTVFPTDCHACHDIIQGFYHAYIGSDNGYDRHASVAQVLTHSPCTCLENEIKKAKIEPSFSQESRVCHLHNMLVGYLKHDKVLC